MSGVTSSQANSASTATFTTALVFNAIVFAAELLVFTVLRPRFKFIYEPRSFTANKAKRTDPLSAGTISWPLAVYRSDYKAILRVNGVDSYFFVRFLRMMVRIFVPIWVISWIVLLPATSVGTFVEGHTGLDKFIFGNVAKSQQVRYAAHLILAWVFTGWIFWNIKKEMRHFVTTRQEHLIDPIHSSSVQATTILVTGIPKKYLNESALRRMYSHLPGGVKQVWINHDLKKLPDFYNRRLNACNKLESAETTLLKLATKAYFKDNKTPSKGKKELDTEATAPGEGRPLTEPSIHTAGSPDLEQNASTIAKLVPANKRPSHRLPLGFMPFALPFVGQKVDTIEWAREEIRTCDEVLEKGRAVLKGDSAADKGTRGGETDAAPGDAEVDEPMDNGKKASEMGLEEYPAMNSAFVQFHQQIAAHMAAQVLTHHEPYRMTGKYSEVAPDDVIWGNLGLNPYEMKVRTLISYAATSALIIFWAIPVAFVGVISNVHALCLKYSWLHWICTLPSVVVGIISGILPPVLLAVLMMLLPIVLRLLARLEGIPQKKGVELSLMTRYFIFQVVHSFLIITVASGLVSFLGSLSKNATGIPSLLAQKLPQASTFFLTYIVLQGLSGTAGGFLQIVGLIVYYVKLFLLGSTPRSVFNIKYGGATVAWGTLFPSITLIVVISFAYMLISPIINGFACALFFAFYMMYKYLFLYKFEMPASGDTGGLFFPKAIDHVFVGLYIQQFCMAGLFFLAQNDKGKPSAVPQGALMIVLVVITFLFQSLIHNSYGPLYQALPLTLADKTYDARAAAKAESRDAPSVSGGPADPIEMQPREKDSRLQDDSPLNHGGKDEPSTRHMTEEDYGFQAPTASRPQRTIWLPQDPIGLVKEEEAACRSAGVETSARNASMNEKGKVDISGPPPDEAEDQ